MNNKANQVWACLQENGIVRGEQPDSGAADSPWYVKLLLAFSGWLAAIFMLIFFGIAFDFFMKDSTIAGIAGLLMIAGSFGLLRIPANEFVEHLGLAVSLVGQALAVYALFELSDYNETTMTWSLLAVFQAVLVVLMPNFVHRIFSTLAASMAFIVVLHKMNILDVAGGVLMFGAAFCWLHEFRYPKQMTKIRAIGYGLVFALITFKCTVLFADSTFGAGFLQSQAVTVNPWIGEIIISVVTLYVVWHLLRRYGQVLGSRISIMALLATVLVCAVSVNVQGITLGMLILCLGFLGSNRVLLGLGIVSLLFYISAYYYLLDATLLDKSLSLFVAGLVLLLVRWLMKSTLPAHHEA